MASGKPTRRPQHAGQAGEHARPSVKDKQKASRKRSWAPVAGVAAVALVTVVAFVVLVGPGVKGIQATGGSGAAAGMSATAASAAATTDADANAGDPESEEATKYENIVLLVHDSATKQTTVEALPRIIEYYQGLGYTFEAIDRSSIVAHHGTNN